MEENASFSWGGEALRGNGSVLATGSKLSLTLGYPIFLGFSVGGEI